VSVNNPTTTEVLLGLLVLILIAALSLGGRACWADHVYGDWTCGFSECSREFK
jgi:hypothetical protein